MYDELFKCLEFLFKPSLNEFEYDEIDKTLFNSHMKCDPNIYNELYSIFVLSNRNSMKNWFDRQIEKEMMKYATWIGGFISKKLLWFEMNI